MQHLRVLELGWCDHVIDEDMVAVACLQRLTRLQLSMSGVCVGGESCRCSVQTHFCQVRDEGLLQLCTHTGLGELALAGLPVTSIGLGGLRDMKHLAALDLTWCNQMGDAGMVLSIWWFQGVHNYAVQDVGAFRTSLRCTRSH